MRIRYCVPMITLCLLLGCGAEQTEEKDLQAQYREMSGCEMEAVVSCDQMGNRWEATLRCSYDSDGESRVEVISPEELAGVRAVVEADSWRLEYEDLCLYTGTLSEERMSPALCLPRLMSALREGWLLETNAEEWNEVPCVRLMLDQTGISGTKVVSTLWLRQDDGTPLRGEIAVNGENLLTAEFTSFQFCDTVIQ